MTPALVIDDRLHKRKVEILAYFRHRAEESLTVIRETHGETEFKERAIAVNKAIAVEKDRLIMQLRQIATREHWDNAAIIPKVLLLTHCSNVVMLEARNSVWPYEYMTFSRRIGEMWEPFCNICFEYPVRNDVSLFVPPLFEEVRERLANEIRAFIASLPISGEQKDSLIEYYDKVWGLVTSGGIQLTLDLHFKIGETRYVVDFKSGFSSNEKGNTNRLLLVASIYRNIEPQDYKCMLFVRSAEDQNNHYLQTLKTSGLWEVFCGDAAYAQVKEYSGFDIKGWIDANVTWAQDIGEQLRDHLTKNNLLKYLTW